MNPTTDILAYQGIAPHFLGTGKKSTGTGTTKKPLEGITGGRSVSPVAEGNTLMIASAGQNAGTTEPTGCTLLCRETPQKAVSREAATISVDRTDSEQTQLQYELTIISGLKEKYEPRRQTMLMTVHKAANLANSQKLEEANEVLKPVFEYVKETEDANVTCMLCRTKAHILLKMNKLEEAFFFLQRAKDFDDLTNFPERFFALCFMLGAKGNIIDNNWLFKPDEFYQEIRKWLADDETKNEELDNLLEMEFSTQPPIESISFEIKTFRQAIQAIFKEKNVTAAMSAEESLAKLVLYKEPKTSILSYALDILNFAKNLKLVKEGVYNEAIKNIKKNASRNLKHLDEYIHCQILRKCGRIDQAIENCEQGLLKGFPFEKYLSDLRQEKAKHVDGVSD